MALKVEIIHAQDLIRTTPDGELDQQKTREMFDAIGTAAEKLTDFVILMDLRNIENATVTVTQLWHLAEYLITYGRVFLKPAALLLPADDSGDRARFFETCAQNRGFKIRVFKNFEEALNWLACPKQ